MADNLFETFDKTLYRSGPPVYKGGGNPLSDISNIDPSNIGDGYSPGNVEKVEGALQSGKFETGIQGWSIDADGNAEFNDGTFRGTFDIGGTTITIDNTKDIQTYLDTIDAAGGGTLFLQNGTYTLTSDILIPGGVTLEGVSRDGVILDCNSSYSVKITGTDVYSTGTVTINNSDTTVVGSGTTWTSGMVGRYILLDGLWYEITAFTDTTHITIDTYNGINLSGSLYVIANTNFSGAIRKVTIIGSTGAGLVSSYSMEAILDDIGIFNCGTGIDFDYVTYPHIFVTSNDNGVNMDLNYVEGFYVDFSDFSNSTTGNGVTMNQTRNSTFFNSSVNDNTGDGINSTDCSKIAFISFDISGNGGQGIEFVSGCNDNQFTDGVIDGNTSDGLKLTATSDRNTLVAISIKNNGGYGINIAASNCDNNQIIAPAFDNNTSGNINDSGTNTFVSPENTNYFTAGMNITAGNAVYVSNGTTGYVNVISSNTNTTGISFGQTTGPVYLAQSVTPASAIYCGGIQVQMAQFNTTTDQVVVALQADSAGQPSGSDIAVTAGVTIPSGGDALYTFNFSSTQLLTGSTKYWFVIRRTGALSNPNYYEVRSGASGYAGGSLFKYESSAWSDLSTDAYFNIRELLPSGYVGVTEADVSGRYQNFIGFAKSTITTGGQVGVTVSGQISGLSGLTPGQYYLSDTAGAISSSAGSNTRKVGIALSATTLLITNIW